MPDTMSTLTSLISYLDDFEVTAKKEEKKEHWDKADAMKIFKEIVRFKGKPYRDFGRYLGTLHGPDLVEEVEKASKVFDSNPYKSVVKYFDPLLKGNRDKFMKNQERVLGKDVKRPLNFGDLRKKLNVILDKTKRIGNEIYKDDKNAYEKSLAKKTRDIFLGILRFSKSNIEQNDILKELSRKNIFTALKKSWRKLGMTSLIPEINAVEEVLSPMMKDFVEQTQKETEDAKSSGVPSPDKFGEFSKWVKMLRAVDLAVSDSEVDRYKLRKDKRKQQTIEDRGKGKDTEFTDKQVLEEEKLLKKIEEQKKEVKKILEERQEGAQEKAVSKGDPLYKDRQDYQKVDDKLRTLNKRKIEIDRAMDKTDDRSELGKLGEEWRQLEKDSAQLKKDLDSLKGKLKPKQEKGLSFKELYNKVKKERAKEKAEEKYTEKYKKIEKDHLKGVVTEIKRESDISNHDDKLANYMRDIVFAEKVQAVIESPELKKNIALLKSELQKAMVPTEERERKEEQKYVDMPREKKKKQKAAERILDSYVESPLFLFNYLIKNANDALIVAELEDIKDKLYNI